MDTSLIGLSSRDLLLDFRWVFMDPVRQKRINNWRWKANAKDLIYAEMSTACMRTPLKSIYALSMSGQTSWAGLDELRSPLLISFFFKISNEARRLSSMARMRGAEIQWRGDTLYLKALIAELGFYYLNSTLFMHSTLQCVWRTSDKQWGLTEGEAVSKFMLGMNWGFSFLVSINSAVMFCQIHAQGLSWLVVGLNCTWKVTYLRFFALPFSFYRGDTIVNF